MDLSVVILPSERWAQSRAHWRRADESGLYAAYTYDHLSWRSFRERGWFTMVPTLCAAAAITERVRLGPLVTSPNFRHPLVLAKDLLALDDLSNGRCVVGVGAGGTGFDATALGQDPWSARERHERFVEFTRTLERLLREPASDVEGTYYRVVDSRQLPGPVQRPRPPLVLSALGPKSLALAAEIADGWVSFGSPRGEVATRVAVAEQVERLNAELAARQRDATSLRRVILHFGGDEAPLASYDAFLDWARVYHDLGFDEAVVHWPVTDSDFDTPADVFDRVLDEGVTELGRWVR